jgi:hypothetical protein
LVYEVVLSEFCCPDIINYGTAGMKVIKRCGGICIVQDPEEAEHPAMP